MVVVVVVVVGVVVGVVVVAVVVVVLVLVLVVVVVVVVIIVKLGSGFLQKAVLLETEPRFPAVCCGNWVPISRNGVVVVEV